MAEEKKDKDKFFKGPFWKAVVGRFEKYVPATGRQKWSNQQGFGGFRFDLVISSEKGITLQSFIKVCDKLKLSPTWLLFDEGRETLSEIRVNRSLIERLLHIVKNLPRSEVPGAMKIVEEVQRYESDFREDAKDTGKAITGSTGGHPKKV